MELLIGGDGGGVLAGGGVEVGWRGGGGLERAGGGTHALFLAQTPDGGAIPSSSTWPSLFRNKGILSFDRQDPNIVLKPLEPFARATIGSLTVRKHICSFLSE